MWPLFFGRQIVCKASRSGHHARHSTEKRRAAQRRLLIAPFDPLQKQAQGLSWDSRLWLLFMSWSGQTCPALASVSPSGDTNASTQMYLITEATASGLQEVKERELVAIATLLPWPAKSIIGALGCVDLRALDGCQPLERPHAATRSRKLRLW